MVTYFLLTNHFIRIMFFFHNIQPVDVYLCNFMGKMSNVLIGEGIPLVLCRSGLVNRLLVRIQSPFLWDQGVSGEGQGKPLPSGGQSQAGRRLVCHLANGGKIKDVKSEFLYQISLSSSSSYLFSLLFVLMTGICMFYKCL